MARAVPLLFVALSAAAQVPQPDPAPVPPPKLPAGIRIVELRGLINQGAVSTLRGVFESVDPARLPAGAIVLLDSPGGDGLAAIEIGRMVHTAKAHVFVRGRCDSACVYILAGGVVRGVARDHAVGIHSPRLTTFVKGIGVVDINSASNPNAAAALEAGNRRSRDYFREMGLPEALFAAMAATPADKMRRLDLAELPDLGLTGFDPAYLAGHAPAAARVYRISEQEYERRTLGVPGKCLAEKVTPNEFVACYRRVLRTGE